MKKYLVKDIVITGKNIIVGYANSVEEVIKISEDYWEENSFAANLYYYEYDTEMKKYISNGPCWRLLEGGKF